MNIDYDVFNTVSFLWIFSFYGDQTIPITKQLGLHARFNIYFLSTNATFRKILSVERNFMSGWFDGRNILQLDRIEVPRRYQYIFQRSYSSLLFFLICFRHFNTYCEMKHTHESLMIVEKRKKKIIFSHLHYRRSFPKKKFLDIYHPSHS